MNRTARPGDLRKPLPDARKYVDDTICVKAPAGLMRLIDGQPGRSVWLKSPHREAWAGTSTRLDRYGRRTAHRAVPVRAGGASTGPPPRPARAEDGMILALLLSRNEVTM